MDKLKYPTGFKRKKNTNIMTFLFKYIQKFKIYFDTRRRSACRNKRLNKQKFTGILKTKLRILNTNILSTIQARGYNVKLNSVMNIVLSKMSCKEFQAVRGNHC